MARGPSSSTLRMPAGRGGAKAGANTGIGPNAAGNQIQVPEHGYSEAKTYGESIIKLRSHVDARIIGLRQVRYSWWCHWREIADYLLPRRYTWLCTPNELWRGMPINQNIIDPTATKASQICSAGLMSGVSSPGKPWFSATIPDIDAADTSPVKIWLATVVERILRVMAGSNYYSAKATQYQDLVVFGTAPMLIQEDDQDIIRCINPCAGEYFVANSARLAVDTFAREFVLTVAQVCTMFGLDKVKPDTRRLFENGGASLSREIKIYHMIEPNNDEWAGHIVPSRFPWREIYWEAGSTQDRVLSIKPYHEQPFSCPRWDLSGNDAYGRSPGMDALGCTKQLQLEQRRKAQGIDKHVNPPLKAHVSMKNQPAMMMPGGVTYVTDMSAANSGIAPVYEVMPQLQEMLEDIQDVRTLIEKMFFVDLFQMLSDSDKNMTAFEVARRQEEKLVVLGPVIERNENEGLDPDIDRIFAIMQRRGMIPPAPPEIHGMPIEIQYVSMLSQAQKAASTSALEQLIAFVGSLQQGDIATAQAGGQPTSWDNIERDELVDEYADMLGVSPRVIRATMQVQQIRAQRGQAAAQAQQQAQNMQALQQASQSAKNLSQVDVGGGQNAVQAMLGAAGAGQPAMAQ